MSAHATRSGHCEEAPWLTLSRMALYIGRRRPAGRGPIGSGRPDV